MKTDSHKPRFFALIPCAGNGSRAGTSSPKQYQILAGHALVWHTVQAFRSIGPRLTGLCLVVAKDDVGFATACPDFPKAHETLLPEGGATRAASVLAGLRALLANSAAPSDWVLVHDAARCLVTPSQILALMDACQDDPVGGLLAQKLPDTLKAASGDRVTATLDRGDKWLAQTPQMFRIGPLEKALLAAGDQVTDEASAMELSGLQPLLVPGSLQNFKVTYPDDLVLAQLVLAHRQALDATGQ